MCPTGDIHNVWHPITGHQAQKMLESPIRTEKRGSIKPDVGTTQLPERTHNGPTWQVERESEEGVPWGPGGGRSSVQGTASWAVRRLPAATRTGNGRLRSGGVGWGGVGDKAFKVFSILKKTLDPQTRDM